MPKLNTASTEPKTAGDMRHHNTRALLYNYVQRFERLQEECDALGEDKKEVMAEAKGLGFDTAILRKVIARRKHNAADIQEADAIMDLYEETIRLAEADEKTESEADAE